MYIIFFSIIHVECFKKEQFPIIPSSLLYVIIIR